MLKIILNRLQPQAEEIIAAEPAVVRAGRSSTEQIFHLEILCKKCLQHQYNLYHVLIDFKKAFDRVWHEALSVTIGEYNINGNIIRAIENLYDKAESAVLFYDTTGDCFSPSLTRSVYSCTRTISRDERELRVRHCVSVSQNGLIPTSDLQITFL